MEHLVAEEEKTQTAVAEKSGNKKRATETKPLVYFENAKVICACGNSFTTGSTREEIRVEICNNCHPFYTGQEKFVDTEGRVERFKRMDAAKKERKEKKEKEKKDSTPKTLKEMLASLENK
jgi:large subunit ribosomal protein L31